MGCLRGFLFAAVCLLSAAAPAQPTSLPEVGGGGECAAISARDPQLAPLTQLCRFARSYRQALPNFLCDQTVTAHDDRPWNNLAPRVMTAVVTYVGGEETYSSITIDGVPSEWRRLTSRAGVPLTTSGEFGNDLVALFRLPIGAEFKFAREQRLHGKRAQVFEFHLPAAKNSFWSLRDASGATLFPEYRGRIWIAVESDQQNRLLKLGLQPANLPDDFLIESAQVATDYSMISLGEAGNFVLPTRSETWACVKSEGELAQVRCARNELRFHGCRKFAATTRILSDASRK